MLIVLFIPVEHALLLWVNIFIPEGWSDLISLMQLPHHQWVSYRTVNAALSLLFVWIEYHLYLKVLTPQMALQGVSCKHLMLSPLGKNEKIKRLCNWNFVSDFLPLHVQAWGQDLKLIRSESQVIERGFCVGRGWFLHPASRRIVRNPRKRKPYHVTILLAKNKVNQQQKIYPRVSSFLSFILKFLLWVVRSNTHRQTQLTTCLKIWHIRAV